MTTIRRKMQKHGLIINGKKHPIYKLRERMIMYCFSIKENHKAYLSYKGKGIKVCDEWVNNVLSFYNWCINNGWAPGLTIDRINSNGDYEPSNCRFITRSENSKKARAENNQNGINSSNVILDDEKVLIIRKLIELGCKSIHIAQLFEVAPTTISSIKNNINWKHLKENYAGDEKTK